MDLVAKTMGRIRKEVLSEDPPPVKKATPMDDEAEVWLTPPKWAHRWKRLVTMTRMVDLHAATGVVIERLETIRERQAKAALELYQRMSRESSMPLIANRNPKIRNIDPKPMAKGKALARSTVKKFALDPEDCPHVLDDMSNPRGTSNQKWMTCLRCGSRWERVWDTPSSSGAPCSTQSLPGSNPLRRPPPSAPETMEDGFVTVNSTESESETPPVVMAQLTQFYDQLRRSGHTEVQAVKELMAQATTAEEIAVVASFVKNLAVQTAVETPPTRTT